MKAKKYISEMLVVLIFATVSIQAQTTRRPVSQENKVKVKSTETASKQQAYNKQPARTNQGQQVRKQPAGTNQGQQIRKQPARTNQGQQVKRQNVGNNNGRQYVRNQNANSNNGQQQRNQNGYKEPRQQEIKPIANKKQVQQVHRPVSMTTTKNPRSTYRKPNNKYTTGVRYSEPVRSKTYYTGRAYYGGNHYHYAYPTRKVKFHYHHNTYVNNYRVLYYPTYADLYWTRNMYRDYHRWYPGYSWNYSYGYRLQTISAFDAKYYLGEVALVYGRVYATWHNKETDDFLLFFGGDFPYQEFTVVVPGHVARKFSWRPERYFLGEHVTINGLITTFDGSPEIVVKNKRQIALY